MTRAELLKIAKPCLFNTEMTKAILDDRKKATRRLVKFKDNRNPNWTGYIKDGLTLYNGTNEPCNKPAPCKVGDILYVRETWQCWRAHRYEATADIMFRAGGEGIQIQFANGNTDSVDRDDFDKFVYKWYSRYGKWKPSLFMPKEAARIFLKVKGVHMERLQEITPEQAVCEGTKEIFPPLAVDEFRDIWNSTIKKTVIHLYGWEANPWVWVIEFERIEPDT